MSDLTLTLPVMEESWSDAALSLWAKTNGFERRRDASIPRRRGRLVTHLDDTARIAAWLVDHALAPRTVDMLSSDLGADHDELCRALFALGGLHDLGKATPSFRLDDGCGALALDHGLLSDRGQKVGYGDFPHFHALAGELLLLRYLRRSDGRNFGLHEARAWAQIVGGHHGIPTRPGALTKWENQSARVLGSTGNDQGPWGQVQAEILERYAGDLPNVVVPPRTQQILTGLLIYADWIASNDFLFPLVGDRSVDPERRFATAIKRLSIPKPWVPVNVPTSNDELFAARVAKHPSDRLWPAQTLLVDAARNTKSAVMMIFEGPTGGGKSEAAWLAAEILAHNVGCHGVTFALPTQATSDSMFDRFLGWVERLPQSDPSELTVWLGHAKARLNPAFEQIVQGTANDKSLAHWLLTKNRKLSPLASFTVTTVDQVLLAGKQLEHQMLRHLALAGKVIIIDEVHAYDTWMSGFLDAYLAWAGEYQIPVILLSATLPPQRRNELVAAYLGSHEPADTRTVTGYPLLTIAGRDELRTLTCEPATRQLNVLVRFIGTSDMVALQQVREVVDQGGNVLVIRNTVRRCVSLARACVDEFGEANVTVNHARFVAADRSALDRRLIHLFGPDGARPHGHVVVATQVAEQSLDIDFDLVISDVAPIELIIQRIGREHRHDRPNRPIKMAEFLITGVDILGADPIFDPSFRYIYDQFTLLRCVELLAPTRTLRLPADVESLIADAYNPITVPGSTIETALQERLATKQADEQSTTFARIPTAAKTNSKYMADFVPLYDRAQPDDGSDDVGVRHGAPSVEVVILERLANGSLAVPSWATRDAGKAIPTSSITPDLFEVLARQAVRLGAQHHVGGEVHTALVRDVPDAWKDKSGRPRFVPLVLDANATARVGERTFSYHRKFGLADRPKEEPCITT